MSAIVFCICGVLVIIVKILIEASKPKQKGKFNYRKYLNETNGKGYSSKKLRKMANSGRWHNK